jgi:hypothetical protein
MVREFAAVRDILSSFEPIFSKTSHLTVSTISAERMVSPSDRWPLDLGCATGLGYSAVVVSGGQHH